MATVTISYTALSAPSTSLAAQICSIFVPTNAASDLPAFDGTYYDTNVAGFGEGMSIEAFVAKSIAHPGLILALKKAVADGSYAYEENDADEIAYVEEAVGALADQGFTVAVDTE